MSKTWVNDEIPRTQTRQGLEYLAHLARAVPEGGLVVDLWPLFGASTWVLARNAHPSVRVLGLDSWKPQAWIGAIREKHPGCPPLSRQAFESNLRGFANVEAVEGEGVEGLGRREQPIDLLFGDPTGREASYVRAVEALMSRLRPGGIAAGAGYGGAAAEVLAAVARWAQQWGARPEVAGRVWAMLRPAAGARAGSVYDRVGPYSEHDLAVSVRLRSGQEMRYAPGSWAGSLHEWKPIAALRLDWAVPRQDGLTGVLQLMNSQKQLSDWTPFGEWAQVAGNVAALRGHLLGAGSAELKLAYQCCCLLERRGGRAVTRNTKAFRDAAWSGLDEGVKSAGISAVRVYAEQRTPAEGPAAPGAEGAALAAGAGA